MKAKVTLATPLGPAFDQRASQGKEGPACTPTVDGERLYVVGLAGNLACLQAKDGKVYLLDRDDKVGDNLRCLDLSSGKELWNFAHDAPGRVSFPGSRSVPAIDGNHVYSCGHNGDLYCIDINTHTGPSGIRTFGWILAASQRAARQVDLDRAAPVVFPSGQLRSAHWFTAICLLLPRKLLRPASWPTTNSLVT